MLAHKVWQMKHTHSCSVCACHNPCNLLCACAHRFVSYEDTHNKRNPDVHLLVTVLPCRKYQTKNALLEL
jgi:hypothetical protein